MFLTTQKLDNKYTKQSQCLLESIESLLPFSEWSLQLLEDSAVNCEFDKNYHYILFPDGISQVMDSFSAMHDQKMLSALKKYDIPIRVREKIALALKCRIKNTSKTIHIKNNVYFIKPDNICLGLKTGYRTCDLIWQWVGDNSTDFNYYTKRGLLFSVYISSILFFIADESKDSSATDAFIDKALQNVINIAKFKKSCSLPSLVDVPILRLLL